MSSIKTAISIDQPLYEQAEALAREMKISRSRLYELALEAFLRREESQNLLARLDAVYREEEPEPALTQQQRASHRRVVEGTW